MFNFWDLRDGIAGACDVATCLLFRAGRVSEVRARHVFAEINMKTIMGQRDARIIPAVIGRQEEIPLI